ncbi:MAG: substrate-binding domain-containing protein [Raoultibacter sp.]
MKKKLVGVVLCALLAFGVFGMAGCSGTAGANTGGTGSASSPSGDISVYSREDGSGTRGAFIELFGIQKKDSAGKTVDLTTPQAAITNSTSVMMTSIAGDPNGIGYISLGSLNDTVRALQIDGAQATAANVASGTYKIARPFNVATKTDLSEQAKDFMAFIMSADGQKIVVDNGYIAADSAAAAYTASGKSGKIVVAGSSSVTPVMEKLSEAYQKINSGVTVEVQQSDSTTGMNMAKDATCDIGMASREVKDSEKSAGLAATVIARDGIAVIVNKEASIESLTSEQVMKIYTGEALLWEDIVA